MEFEDFRTRTLVLIGKQIKIILKNWREEVKKVDVSLLPLVDKFIKACNGGKRLRGGLVVLGYELGKQSAGIWQQASDKEIFKIAAAYEIFHTAILAHDDVIDQSLIRRGQASLPQVLGGGHYGLSQAICLGDCGFFLSLKVIAGSSFSEERRNKALEHFSSTMLETGLGQMLDVKKGEVETIMSLKTAKYSISGPLQLGVILAGGNPELIKKLGVFGEKLGMAFQIQDDVLGVFGSVKQIGKSVVSDIEEGKNTLLFRYALKKSNLKQKEVLKKLYGKSRIQAQQAKLVREVFEQTGALDLAKIEAGRYRTQALKALPYITKDKIMSALLQQLAEYLVERDK